MYILIFCLHNITYNGYHENLRKALRYIKNLLPLYAPVNML